MVDTSTKKPELLIEYASFNYDTEDEEFKTSIKDKSKPLILKGIIQRCNTLNQNGRVYPREILLREIEKYKKQVVAEKRAFGTLDHEDSPTVSMQSVSHMITDIKIDGDTVYGTVRIFDNPNGQIVRSIVEAGGIPGISSRALGSLRSETITEGPGRTIEVNVVEDDLNIICWDIVSEPSTPGAFLSLSEAKVLTPEQLNELKSHKMINKKQPSTLKDKVVLEQKKESSKKIIQIVDNLLSFNK